MLLGWASLRSAPDHNHVHAKSDNPQTLRHMNNYNALGAVIAGINGTAVHRLSLTRELVNPNTHRQFMRLELLMGTHMSHSKYRLAWENTSTERIPFIPLHRRDLVSADEGNRTFLADGDKINWNKFQVMGDVLMVLVRSQATPYRDLARNHIVEKLITDAVVSMDDDVSFLSKVPLTPLYQSFVLHCVFFSLLFSIAVCGGQRSYTVSGVIRC